MKTRKTYQKPVMESETFVPNEHVAACWFVACEIGIQGAETGAQDEGGATHKKRSDGRGCGHATNQHIYNTWDGGFAMEEVNWALDGTGPLPCTIVTQDVKIEQGARIEWTTSSGATTWRHYGFINLEDQSRPNHS